MGTTLIAEHLHAQADAACPDRTGGRRLRRVRRASDRESEPLATSSSGPIAFLRAERTKTDATTGIGPPHKLVVTDSEGGNEARFHARIRHRHLHVVAGRPAARLCGLAAVVSAHGQDVQYSIFVANADGTGVRKIRPIPSYLSNPTWSPRGT